MAGDPGDGPPSRGDRFRHDLDAGRAPLAVRGGAAAGSLGRRLDGRRRRGGDGSGGCRDVVMSALHRNAGIIAKTVETLDEISGGRFLFGLDAGHAWPGQAHAFGLPEDNIFGRFEEALEVIVPLLRSGRADFEGTW